MKYVISLFYPVLLTLFSFIVLNHKDLKRIIKQNWKWLVVFLAFSFLVGNVFLYFHFSQEHYLYFWDFSGFWRKTIEFNRMLEKNPLDALKMVYESMLYAEYSYFPEWFLSLPLFVLGNTFPRFVVSMYNFFVMPFNFLMALAMLVLTEKLEIKYKASLIVVLFLLTFFTGNILPMNLGYIGSAGLPFIALVVLVLLNVDFTQKQIGYSFFIGVNLILLVLIRRWYSYVALSFFVAFPLAYGTSLLVGKTKNINQFKNLLVNTFLIGMCSLLILVIFFNPLFKTFISYDYQYAYQSAKVGGYLYAMGWFKTFYSPLQTGIFLWGAVFGMLDPRLRKMTIFLSLSVLIVIVIFYQVQVFGSHHYYIINTYVLFVMFIGIIKLLELFETRYRYIISISLIILIISNFTSLFIKRTGSVLNKANEVLSPFSTTLHNPPRYRSDVEIVRDIASYLTDTPKAYEYIYVLAGSADFNDDLLRNAWLPDILNSVPMIEPTSQLDTRDGVPKMFFKYTYVAVADPIQYHNGAEYQKVIGILADGMLNDPELNQFYEIVKTFTITNDIKIYIYKQIDDVPNKVIQKYTDIFKSFYPNDPKLYEFDF